MAGGPAVLRQVAREDGDAPDRSATFLDYLPGRPVVLVSEPDEVKTATIKQREHIEASHADAQHKQQRALAPESLVVGWNDVAPLVEHSTALETLCQKHHER